MSSESQSAYEKFKGACVAIGTTPAAQEMAVLSIGRAFLPPCALVVLDGGEGTEEYWTWIGSQLEQVT